MTDKTCEWELTPVGIWVTECGGWFHSIRYTNNPMKEGMNFCCYCGGKLKQVDYKEDESDDKENLQA